MLLTRAQRISRSRFGITCVIAAGRGRWPCRSRLRPRRPAFRSSVGCGWIVSARSRAAAPISMASTASAIRSPAPAPTMPQPSSRLALRIDEPLGQALGAADRLGPAAGGPGELGHLDLAALLLGLGLGQAGPGDLRIGEDHGRDGPGLEDGRLAGQGLDGHLALVGRLVGQHRLAGHVADGQDVRIGRAPLRVDARRSPAASISTLVFSRPRPSLLGRRPTDTSTRLNCWTFGFRRRPRRSLRSRRPCRPGRRPWCRGRWPRTAFSSRLCSGLTRSRSAPGSRPSVISTTETRLPRAA